MDAKELLGALSNEELSEIAETLPQTFEERGMTIPVADSVAVVEPETKEFIERIAKINDITEEQVIVGAIVVMMKLDRLGLKSNFVTHRPWCEDPDTVTLPYSLKPFDVRVGPAILGY